MKKTLLALFALAAGMASAQVAYTSVDPAENTVLPKAWGNYANMSFTFTFDEAVTVTGIENVKLYELGDTGATEIEPDDAWTYTSSNGGKTIQVWASDWDGFTCSFSAKDCDYQLVIPAGTFAAGGNTSDEYTINYYGQNAPVVPVEPLVLLSVNPMEETALGADSSYPLMSFTLNFNQPVEVASTDVKLVKEAVDGTEIEPSDEWRYTMSNNNATVQFWGADYDGFVDYFAVEDCEYYFIVPAGAIKAGDAVNEAFAFHYYGTGIPTAISEVGTDATEVARYDINGRRTTATAAGVQLVKMSDGSVLKVIVK